MIGNCHENVHEKNLWKMGLIGRSCGCSKSWQKYFLAEFDQLTPFNSKVKQNTKKFHKMLQVENFILHLSYEVILWRILPPEGAASKKKRKLQFLYLFSHFFYFPVKWKIEEPLKIYPIHYSLLSTWVVLF